MPKGHIIENTDRNTKLWGRQRRATSSQQPHLLAAAPPRAAPRTTLEARQKEESQGTSVCPKSGALGSAESDRYHNAAPAGTVEGVGGHGSPVLVLNVQGGVGKLRHVEQKVEHRVKGGGAGSYGTKRREVRTPKHAGAGSSLQVSL